MRINHNISALNAWRQINQTNYSMSKTLERLSSGLRINRAGDDAAGLAISEKMRGQIKGLNMAIKNAQDAISLIQTAEGALTEVHSILQRMRELAVQAASDTNTDVDREQIQKELDQLREEIDRIARTTEFNTKKLLDGKLESFRNEADVKVVTGGNLNVQVDMTLSSGAVLFETDAADIDNNESYSVNLGGSAFTVSLTNNTISIVYGGTTIGTITGVTAGATSITLGDVKFTFTASSIAAGAGTVQIDSVKLTLTTSVTVNLNDAIEGTYAVEVGQFVGTQTSELDIRLNLYDSTGLKAQSVVDFDSGSVFVGTVVTAGVSTIQLQKGFLITWDTTVYSLSDFGGALPNEEVVDSGVVRAEAVYTSDTQLVFQIGANEGHNMIAGIDDMSAGALGLTTESLKVTDQNAAERAIMVVDAAIYRVSTARAALGAIQNRLEHTIANLGVAAENLTAAESRIRDADMAKEMMEFTKQQILLQSSMAMLAQANVLPQNVLQLMR